MQLAFQMIFSNPFVPVPRRLSWRELAPVWRQLHAKSQEAGSAGPLAVSFSPTVPFVRTSVIHNGYSRPSRLQRLFTKYVVRTYGHVATSWLDMTDRAAQHAQYSISDHSHADHVGTWAVTNKTEPRRHVSSPAETRQLSRDR